MNFKGEKKVAIFGLGLIGSAWAVNVEADGILAATWNRSFKAGSKGAPRFEPDLNKAVERAEILHFVVADEEAIASLITRVQDQLTSDKIVIQSTTIDPATSDKLRQIVEGRGAKYLEAPFTGSLPAAQTRNTIFYLGGAPEVVESALLYLSRLGTKRVHIGSNVQACAIKLAMNLQIVSIVEVLSEALKISRDCGIADDIFFSALRENAAFSGVASLKESKLKNADFSPQFSVKHMAKDMRLLSNYLGDELPMLSTVRRVLGV